MPPRRVGGAPRPRWARAPAATTRASRGATATARCCCRWARAVTCLGSRVTAAERGGQRQRVRAGAAAVLVPVRGPLLPHLRRLRQVTSCMLGGATELES